MSESTPLLQVRDLSLRLPTARGWGTAVRGVSFSLQRGQTLGLVGESGSGKSLCALALMGLIPERAQVTGQVLLDDQPLLGMDERAWARLRGNRMAMVFQEPMSALNPVHTIGRQVAEPLRLHRGLSRQAARTRAIELLEQVGIDKAAQRFDAYPHQFSGGQRQRIVIAMALSCEPDLLIADEPTTALDVTIQQQILTLLAQLVAERGMALLLISHDLAVIANQVQRVAVMYGGTMVEYGSTGEVFAKRAHPYTQGLFAARPRINARPGERLTTIPGSVPELADLPPGCPFAGRCPITVPTCFDTPPPLHTLSTAHELRCARLQEALALPRGGDTVGAA